MMLLTLIFNKFAMAELLNEDRSIKPEVYRLIEIVRQNSDNMFAQSVHGIPNKLTLESLSKENLTPKILHDFLQTYALRPGERVEKNSINFYTTTYGNLDKTNIDQILNIFTKLGYIGSIFPKQQQDYKYIFIHGATIEVMRGRVNILDQSVRDKKIEISPETKIIFSNGFRKLFEGEKETVLSAAPFKQNPDWKPYWVTEDGQIIEDKEPTNEIEGAKIVWDQLNLHPVLRSLQPVFLDASKLDGKHRATTDETIAEFFKKFTVHSGESCLSVSSAPYGSRQQKTIELQGLKFGKQLNCDTLACDTTKTVKVPDIAKVGILFDEIARELHVQLEMFELIDKQIAGKSIDDASEL